MPKTKTIILGAGPAGLSCGLELIKNNFPVTIFDKDAQVGGISKTLSYKKYLFDIGSHRFFSKSPIVNQLWQETLSHDFKKINRLTRIYYQNKFFPYPIKLLPTLKNLGIFKSSQILFSYFHVKVKPLLPENTFTAWVSNRFGRQLFQIFFKSYTEKVWGFTCDQISADWASQRIKGLSVISTIKSSLFPQANRVKSLINSFHYPHHGAGQMYHQMSQTIINHGGQIQLNSNVETVFHSKNKILKVVVNSTSHSATNFVSSIPITELIQKLSPSAPATILHHAQQLRYRSLLTVNLVLNQTHLFPDNWIYVHSPQVKVGRIQNLVNWGNGLSPNRHHTHLSLEYFCNQDDTFWQKDDSFLIDFALSELITLNLINNKTIFIDGFVVRTPNAYPVYQNHYQTHLAAIKKYLSQFTNLQLIGRYGQFKYNNMDHSILTGLYAAQNLLQPQSKHDLFAVNSEPDYQEE